MAGLRPGTRSRPSPHLGQPVRSTFLQPRLALGMALLALVRRPASSLLAVGVLALGLAAPATFFSFLVGASRPLPVPDGDRIVRVDVVQPSRDGRHLPVLEADLSQLNGSRTLAAVGGFRTFAGTLVDGELAASRVSGAELTPEVLPLLAVRPLLGRIPDGTEPEPALVLAHDLWQEVYRGDPGALGRVVSLGRERVPVVAVMPEGFAFPFRQNAWIVRGVEPGGRGALELVARLADGVEPVSAQEELAVRWGRGDADREEDRVGGVVRVRRFTEGRGEGGEAVAFTGLVLVALCLLVIACANVANLLLVRTTERVRALAIQSALGAGRAQISAQLLSESLLLAALGGISGLVLAHGAVAAVQGSLAAEHFGYHWMRLAVDGSVVAFTAALVLGAALLAGFLPVLRVLQIDVQSVLKEEGGARSVGGGGGWGRVFVTGQLALSCGALVAAGLTGTALVASRDFGAGIPAEQILIASVGVGETPGAVGDVEVREVLDAVASRPGARAVAMAVGAPGYGEWSSPLRLDGADPESAAPATVLWNAVTPGFFDVLDLELRSGRSLVWQDDGEALPVAVVNESFVRRFSQDRPVLGRRLLLSAADSVAWFTVVGVVEDVGLGGGERAREDRVYLPVSQVATTDLLVLTRTGNDAGSLAGAVRRAVAGVDPAVAVWGVRTLADAHAFMIRVPRTIGFLALGGGAAGFLVAAVGLYGLLAFRVRQRRGELGIRLAVGADGPRLAQAVLGWALRLLLPAVAVGLALAWLASPILSVALLGLDPRDPAVYAAVGAAFLFVGLLAALGPALRAAGVDPASTLRRD
jgi:putative ABC transport system permease protein